MTSEPDEHTSHPANEDASGQDDDSVSRSDNEQGGHQEGEGRQQTDREDLPAKENGSPHPDDRRTDDQSADGTNRSGRWIGQEEGELHVSVTIEGEYTKVFERLDHPHAIQQSELDMIVRNLEDTLLAVVKRGGGIRSEIYEATEFELDDPWEIRKYLNVLEMHNLIHQKEDVWMPSDYFEPTS